MEFLIGAGVGLATGLLVERVFGKNLIGEIKMYVEKLLQGVETRIKQDIADVKAEVTKKV
jgi:hypothetical protein